MEPAALESGGLSASNDDPWNRGMYTASMIALIDYGAGNLKSVANACAAIGADVMVTVDPDVIRKSSGIILPGVGAFAEGMDRLRAAGLIPVLTEEVIGKKKPYLGICLGLQFLAEKGFEHGEHEGFGWVKGVVKKIEPNDPECKVPHMGWNSVEVKRPSDLFQGLQSDPVFYFVHSFALEVDPSEKDVVSGIAHHGGEIVASVQKGNIHAVQFHPEKSQNAGLMVLNNFCSLCQ